MTSSVPVLNPSLGTPSGEWADKIASSLDQPSQETPQNSTSEQATSHSPGVTPGNELPGAFPNPDKAETSTGTTNFTETIVGTARQYFPAGVVNTVQTYLGNNNGPTEAAGPDETVKASEHDILHKTSLPSQELGGTLPREHVGGVGSLPGASTEKSVALLPDEQGEWSQWTTFAGKNTPGNHTPSNVQGKDTSLTQTATQKATDLGATTGIVKADTPPKQTTEDIGKGYPETLTGGDIAGAQKAVGDIKLVAFDIKQADDVSMPSTEEQGQQPKEHIGGVGSLPGSKDEQSVAVLPEERATEATETVHQEHHEELGAPPNKPEKSTGVGGVGVGGATAAPKRDTQSKSLQSETVASDPGAAGSESGQPPMTLTESGNLAGVQRSGGSEGSAEAQRKASLKEKISGGMKVVSGKLGHDKSKVEEGKKLMHGQSA